MALPADIVGATDVALAERPTRPPEYAKENAALLRLADEMARCPEQMLGTLCDVVMDVCDAQSAGVSLTTPQGNFYWPAISGAWAKYLGGGMPRDASPCGEVLRHDSVLMFYDVHMDFPAAAGAEPRIREILLAPFHSGEKPIGTVWAIIHDDSKRFDLEDKRCLSSLSKFAGVAFQMGEADRAANDARAQLTILNEELGHRLKNMLAMVMAIATQTLGDVKERDAIDAFQQRLQAMGKAHDVLIDQTWTAAPIALIAEGVLGSIGQLGRADIDGPNVTLGPRSALSLAMVLHELGTNAMKYGALSADGRVSVQWSVEGSDRDSRLSLIWQESGGPRVKTPTRKGFGSRLIRMGIHRSGETTLAYEPEGLRAALTVPLSAAQQA